MATRIKAQVTTTTGRPGEVDAPVQPHGEYDLTKRSDLVTIRAKLSELMTAANDAARHGLVCQVSVMVYSEEAVAVVARRAAANNN